MQPTTEQHAALEAFATGDDLVITAGAGTGKTSTLRMLAESVTSPGVYIAFNRSIADEARSQFPRRVQARTAHSFAAGWARSDQVGAGVLDRLKDRPPFQGTVDLLRLEPMTVATAAGKRTFTTWDVGRWVQNWVRGYCQSADAVLGVEHFPAVPGMLDPNVRAQVATELLPAARRAWEDMTLPGGVCRVGHEVYLKLWQLSEPTLPGAFILFDEAQDASPVMSAVVAAQDSQKVYVGDESQAIYRFTGARDAMRDLEAAHRVQLTSSWRFGPGIADAANTLLNVLGAQLRLTGSPERASRLYDVCPQPASVLCRNNATTIAEIIAAQQHGAGTHLLGGTKDALAFVDGADRLIERGSSSHPELAWFSSWGQAQDYAEHDPHGGEIATLVHLVDTYGTGTLTRALRACVPSEQRAELVVSTAHKAKGREWDAVDLADDFDLTDPVAQISSPGEAGALARDELMLAYVAITRARHALGAGVLVDALDQHNFPPLEQCLAEPVSASVSAAEVEGRHVTVHGDTISLKPGIWRAALNLLDATGRVEHYLAHIVDTALEHDILGELPDHLVPEGLIKDNSVRQADDVLGKDLADRFRGILLAAADAVAPTTRSEDVFAGIAASLPSSVRLDIHPNGHMYALVIGDCKLLGSSFGVDFSGLALINRARGPGNP